jgi:MFS family permease
LITERLGRRGILMICAALFNVGVILEIASPGILSLIYAGRVATGLAVGASSMIIPTYTSECAPSSSWLTSG